MDLRDALTHVFLIAADDHISQEDASYLHARDGDDACATCVALEEVNRLHESLGVPPGQKFPDSVKLEPLSFPLDMTGETTLAVSWEIDELQLAVIRNSDSLDLRIVGALELDALIELRDKMINPAIEHEGEHKRAQLIEKERERIEHESKAEERARQEAERDRAQSFRAVSVSGTITENLTVHGRECSALEFARKRQTLGTVILRLTPDDVIRRLPRAMSGRLNLRFCGRCKPIPEIVRFNAELIGAGPEIVPEELLLINISDAVWEAHHAALARYDQEKGTT